MSLAHEIRAYLDSGIGNSMAPAAISFLQRAANALQTKQAKIDSLMLEFTPEEMTDEQVAEWERNQKPAPEELQVAPPCWPSSDPEPMSSLGYRPTGTVVTG